jgi:hypothetical protein
LSSNDRLATGVVAVGAIDRHRGETPTFG